MKKLDSDPTSLPLNAPRVLILLPFLFFGSGCAALIYEVVWLQMLQLVIGLTAVSLCLLLSIFMGGMCLGSFFLSRFVSPKRHPLYVYALLEFGIGIVSLLASFMVPYIDHIYLMHIGSGVIDIVFRATLACACLLPSTLLMGATLPAVSRWVAAQPMGVSWLGLFYAGNILGASFGSLLSGFFLLRVYDMTTTIGVAVVLNLVVALITFFIARVTPYHSGAQPISRKTKIAPSGSSLIYIAIALSGLCALSAEVIWTRLLSLLFGSTVYTFSIIMAVFLFALGIGSIAASSLARKIENPSFALGYCQLLQVLAIAWSNYMITSALPNWPIYPNISPSPVFLFQLHFMCCFATILPSACLWGASFPLALAAVGGHEKDWGQSTGKIYAANTLGAIIGVVVFSLWIIPSIGSHWGQRLLIGLSVFAAFMAWGRGGESQVFLRNFSPIKRLAVGAVIMASSLLIIGLIPEMPWSVAAYGFLNAKALHDREIIPGIINEKNIPSSHDSGLVKVYCLYMKETLNGSIAVTHRSDGLRFFNFGGKVQASNLPEDLRLQRMLGHIPSLLHPEPKSVLVIGCGAGITAGSFLLNPSVQKLTICDIDPLIPKRVTPFFSKENYNLLKDPRVTVVQDDGRHFLLGTHEKFDIISTDIVDQWIKGAAAFETVDYFEMCKAHLNPGGFVTQWMPFYQIDRETTQSIFASFFKVFPEGSIWSNDDGTRGSDSVLFGQVGQLKIDMDKMQARLDSPEYGRIKASLGEVGFHSATDLWATYAAQGRDLKAWLQNAPLNNDTNLRVQYMSGLAVHVIKPTRILKEIVQFYRFPDNLFVGSSKDLQTLDERIKNRKLVVPDDEDQ